MSLKQLGIIGGGQLALMLLEAAKKLDLKVAIHASQSEPAVAFADSTHFVQTLTIDSLLSFFENCAFATIESEFVNADLIAQALLKSTSQVRFSPSPQSIKTAQDKLSQKLLFKECNLPTADFHEIFQNNLAAAPLKRMFKWAKFGYDGKGNFLFKDQNQRPKLEAFCIEGFKRGGQVYAEELIAFELELAMVFVRESNGRLHHYPLVISEQENSICKLIKGPATKLGVPNKVEKQAVEIGHIISQKLDLVGTFAVEFFYSAQNGLLINEMAPRVHNSGHYTLNCAKTSQFENHIRVVSNQPVGSFDTSPYFSMLNLIGPGNMTKGLSQDFQLPSSSSLFPYWYRKSELKPGRKMGHINFCANDVDSLNKGIEQLKQYDQKLWLNIK